MRPVFSFYCLRLNSCNPICNYVFLPAQDSDVVQLDVTTKEKDSAKMRPLHADSNSADKYGLFNADAWIKKGGAKKKKKSSPSTSSSSSESSVEEPKKKPSEKKK